MREHLHKCCSYPKVYHTSQFILLNVCILVLIKSISAICLNLHKFHHAVHTKTWVWWVIVWRYNILPQWGPQIRFYELQHRKQVLQTQLYEWKHSNQFDSFFYNFDDSNWRQAEAWIVLLAGAVQVNALAQGTLRQFTQWLWIEHPTFWLRGRHFTTELLPPPSVGCWSTIVCLVY